MYANILILLSIFKSQGTTSSHFSLLSQFKLFVFLPENAFLRQTLAISMWNVGIKRQFCRF